MSDHVWTTLDYVFALAVPAIIVVGFVAVIVALLLEDR